MPALSFGMFKEFKIPYPTSRAEQENLIKIFHLVEEQTQKSIALQEKKIANLKQLKLTILAKELQNEAA